MSQGLHLAKSGPNSQYSAGREQTPQYKTFAGSSFSAIDCDDIPFLEVQNEILIR